MQQARNGVDAAPSHLSRTMAPKRKITAPDSGAAATTAAPKAKSKSKAKQKRGVLHIGDAKPSDCWIAIMRNHVLPFLAPRKILRLTMSCRQWRSKIEWDVALRSALLGSTENGHNNVCKLLELAQAGRIWKPSPLRLLQVSCGVRCELLDCGGTFRKRGKPSKTLNRNPVRLIRSDYGIFACWECTQNKLSHNVARYKRDRILCGDIHQHPRAATAEYSKATYMCAQNQFSAGIPIGPLVTVERIVSLGGAEQTKAWLSHQEVPFLDNDVFQTLQEEAEQRWEDSYEKAAIRKQDRAKKKTEQIAREFYKEQGHLSLQKHAILKRNALSQEQLADAAAGPAPSPSSRLRL